MAQVGSLYTSLTLESSSFISGLKKSADAADRQSRIMERSFNAAKTAASGFFAAVSVGSIVAIGKQALDYAANLGEVSQSLGVSTDALQQYSYMATQAGLSQAEMEKALQRLTKTLGEAKAGSDTAERAFAAIGIRGKELAGLNTEQAMLKIADALATIPDPAKRAAIEVALFGRAGQKLDPLLAGGSAAIDELAMAANRLGVVLSSEQIQKADEAADKMAALTTVLQVSIAGVVADNADSIMKLANALAALGERAAAMSDKNWANVWKATGAGAVGGTLAGGFPFGTTAGAAVGFGVGFYGQSGKAMARKSRMPDRGAGSPGWRYDAKTGKWVSTQAATPTTPTTDLEALFRSPSGKASRPEKDAFLESLSKMDLEIQVYRPDATSDDPLLNGSLEKSAAALADEVERVNTEWVERMNSPDAIAAGEKRIRDMEELSRVTTRFAEDLTSGLGQAIIYGESLGKSLIRSIKAASAELIASGLLDLLMGKTGADGSRSGGILQAGIAAASSYFRGPRAAGGPVGGGSSYLVGERGPEMFVPGRSGTIIPNGAMRGMSGGGGVIVHQTIAPNFAGNAATRQEVAWLAGQVGPAAKAAVRDAMDRRGGGWRR